MLRPGIIKIVQAQGILEFRQALERALYEVYEMDSDRRIKIHYSTTYTGKPEMTVIHSALIMESVNFDGA